MSRLVREYALTVGGPEGVEWLVRVHAEADERGHWHGWLEFLPAAGGEALRTDAETLQSEWEDLVYWASGLTDAYLEMALQRAHPLDG